MRRLSFLLLCLGLAVWTVHSAPTGVRADGPGVSPLTGDTVVALDRDSGHRADDMAAVRTLVELVARSQDGGSIAFIVYGLAASQPTRVAAGEAGVDAAAQNALARVRDGATSRVSDQFQALAGGLSYLSGIEAPAGSRVFLVTSGKQDAGSETAREGLVSLGGVFAERGWSVNPVVVPSASPEDRELMGQLAAGTAGVAYDVGTAEGLERLLEDVAGFSASGAVETGVSPGAPALTAFEVPPRTERLTVSFVRQSAGVEISVFNPRGGAVTGDLVTVDAFETPNTLTYVVEAPVAGKWSVSAHGPASMVQGGVDLINPMEVRMVQQAPLPTGEMGVLQARVMVDGHREVLSGAFIEATVSQPDGSTRVYRLDDRGSGGDVEAGDGIFTTAVPASDAQGVNDVLLELRWLQYGAAIRGTGTFRTEAFPIVTVIAAEPSTVSQGGTVLLAQAEVTVGGYPHMVLPSEVETVVTVGDGERFAAQLAPRGVMDGGRAWQFDVQSALSASGGYSVDVSLTGEYLGRAFVAGAPGVMTKVEVMLPPPPPAPRAAVPPAQGAETVTGMLGLPAWAWALMGIAVLVPAVVLAVLWVLKAVPYGYIYDDSGRLVADFSRLSRGLMRRILAKNRVASSEVPGLALRGASFLFSKGRVALYYRPGEGAPSLRVNSQPAGAVTELDEGTWLGVGGRLLRFAGSLGVPRMMEGTAGD